jgi:gluconolactonase
MCNIDSGEAELMTSVPWYPNGIGFGVETDCIYVAATQRCCIFRFPLVGNRLGKPELFADMPFGKPDGFAFDADGNMVVCAFSPTDQPGELQVYDTEGILLDRRQPGSSPIYSNIAIALDGTAFVTDLSGGAVLEIRGWIRAGLQLHPFRSMPRA